MNKVGLGLFSCSLQGQDPNIGFHKPITNRTWAESGALSSARPWVMRCVGYAGISSAQQAGLAQLGERRTEVALQSLHLKVVCSIHTKPQANFIIASLPFMYSLFFSRCFSPETHGYGYREDFWHYPRQPGRTCEAVE